MPPRVSPRAVFVLLVVLSVLMPRPLAAQDADELAREVERLKEQVAALRAQGAAGGALKVGVVDIVRVFDELDEKIDMNAEITQLEERRRTTLRDLIDRVNNLEEKLKVLRPESDEARAATRELTEAKQELRAKGRALEEHTYQKLTDFTRTAYKKISEEIRAYATEAGYDLVLRLRDPELGPVDAKAPARSRYVDLNRRIEYRSILFARPELDFTHAIIKRLNQKYAAEKARRRELGPAPEPEAAPDTSPQEGPREE